MLKVAIVGMPNVGKSTLFNALLKKRYAITHDMPGVTRDYKSASCHFLGLDFELIDTAGWETDDENLSPKMKAQTKSAIDIADVVLLVLDSTRDISGHEADLIQYVRETLGNDFSNCMVILNKSDAKMGLDINEIYSMGITDYISMSSSNRLGFDELYEFLKLKCDAYDKKSRQIDSAALQNGAQNSIDVAIVGRPNAGKSTLFNSMLKLNRAIISDVSGTTRDAISEVLIYNGRKLECIDTAGLRKKGKIDDEIESYSAAASITAIRRAHVVLLVLDATLGIESQEIKIAGVAQNEGKPIIVILNKVDLLRKQAKVVKEIAEKIKAELTESKQFSIILKSAMLDDDNDEIMKRIVSLHDAWCSKISTAKLNKWVHEAEEEHIPPLATSGRRIRFKYITQYATKPPSFKVFCNYPKQLPDSYKRYLRNHFIRSFGLDGVPIRFEITKSNNPYEHLAKK